MKKQGSKCFESLHQVFTKTFLEASAIVQLHASRNSNNPRLNCLVATNFKNTLDQLCLEEPRYLKHPVTIQVQGLNVVKHLFAILATLRSER